MADPAAGVCAVIPALNEEDAVGGVVGGVLEFLPAAIVVDDGSTDRTADRAREAGAEVEVHPENRGKGAALATGFVRARALGFEWVVTLDADGQHDPAEIASLLRVRDETGADVVVGTRMADPAGMPLVRRWTNQFTSSVISRLAGQRIPDSQSGFRLYRLAQLDGVQLSTLNFDAESEILVLLARRGVQVGAAPIRTIYGTETSRIHPVRDTIRFFRLAHRLRRTPRLG